MSNRIEKMLRGSFGVKDRIALKQYDDYSSFDDSGSTGGGDALATILSTVGAAATAGANVYQATQYSTPTQYPTPVNTNVSAHATALPMGSTSILWIVVLVIIGFFAYKQL